MKIKNKGMLVEFCCQTMKGAVLDGQLQIRPAILAGDKDVVITPMAGDYEFISYCPYCPAEIVFESVAEIPPRR